MEIIASVAGGLLVLVGALFVAGAVWSWFAARRMRNECAKLGLYGEAILWRLIMKVGLIVLFLIGGFLINEGGNLLGM